MLLALIVSLWGQLCSNSAHATEWGIKDSTSNFTGERTVALHSEVVPFGKGFAVMRIKCRTGKLEFQISTTEFLSTGSMDVHLRLDDEDVITYELEISTRFQDVGLWVDSDARPFIERLVKADRLRVQITPYSKNPHIVDFDLTGSKKFIGAVYPCS